MTNEAIVREIIRGSIQRAIQESVAALIVLIAFVGILSKSAVGSPMYYGCLLILVGRGVIVGVVWSHALSYRLLRSHPATDAGFWREVFQVQARLLRLVPLWYCVPLGIGGIMFVAPKSVEDIVPFLMVVSIFLVIFAGIIWLNRQAAVCIEKSAKLLAE